MLKQYLVEIAKRTGLPTRHRVYVNSIEEIKDTIKEIWGSNYTITSIWEKVDVSDNGDKTRTSDGTNSCD